MNNIEDASKWEQYALENLRTAETLLKSDWVSYRNVCHPSQQAAEKINISLICLSK